MLGWLADRAGHRIVLLAGVAASVVGNVIALAATSPATFGVAFALAGVQTASITALAQRPQPEPAGQFVMVNGHRLWYRSVGQGTPLLLIPGGPGISHTYFYPSFERFADKFRVIYFDAFGRGKSDRARTPAEYSFQHDVDDVEGLRKALGLDRIVVYGHSYGGIVAQGYALKYPQSLSKLVLADTLYSAEMWQKGNNDTSNVEIQNQLPDVWADIQQLRAKGLKSCDEAYLQATQAGARGELLRLFPGRRGYQDEQRLGQLVGL